jgi:hypothetical protein
VNVVAYDPEYAVVLYRDTPYVLRAPSHLATGRGATELLDAMDVAVYGPDIELPGPREPLPTPELICLCPSGHNVHNPPADLRCPTHHAQLMC